MTPRRIQRAAASGDVASLGSAVERRFGLKLHPVFQTVLADRAFRLLGHFGTRSLADVIERLAHAPDEDGVVRAMKEAASVGETYFFRDLTQLRGIVRALTELASDPNRGGRPLRLWSAGCASGEEPYSLAILLARAQLPVPFEIVATDMNARVLELGRAGDYPARSLRGGAKTGWTELEHRGGRIHVPPEIRARVRFCEHNLVTDPIPSPELGLSQLDAIICRNVLIYVDTEARARLMRGFASACAPRALLAVSRAEYSAMAGLAEFTGGADGVWRRGEHAAGRRAPSSSPGSLVAARGERRIPVPPPTSPAPAPAGSPLPSAAQPIPASSLSQARALADRGLLDDAASRAEAAVREDPTHAEPHYWLGVIAADRGDDHAAASAFERALFLDRRFLAAEIRLGGVLARAGRRDEALKHLNRARKLLAARDPEQPVEGLDVPAAVAANLVDAELEVLR